MGSHRGVDRAQRRDVASSNSASSSGVHVALWFLVLAVGVGKLYRLVLRPGTTLALVLFTIASFHGWLCWTATRHIVLAAALGVLALYSHLQWRETGWRPGRLLSVLGFALSLSASEAALGVIVYLFAFRKLYRLPMPASWRVLSWAPCAHRFRRTAVDTIEMELLGEELRASSLARDQVIQLVGMRATVVDVGGHGPTRVAFRFDRSLDDPSLVFVMWKDGRLQPAAAPAIGAALDVPWDGATHPAGQ